MRRKAVREVPLPPAVLANYRFEPVHYADAYQITLVQGHSIDMPKLAWRLFGSKESYPFYLHLLMDVRDILVTPFNLKTKKQITGQWNVDRQQQQLPFFNILQTSDNELIMGEDDRHLDFRVSILRRKDTDSADLIVSTLVRMNNRLGRFYFALIRPFHRYLVPAMMKKAYGGAQSRAH